MTSLTDQSTVQLEVISSHLEVTGQRVFQLKILSIAESFG
jgi:hypothetical protein